MMMMTARDSRVLPYKLWFLTTAMTRLVPLLLVSTVRTTHSFQITLRRLSTKSNLRPIKSTTTTKTKTTRPSVLSSSPFLSSPISSNVPWALQATFYSSLYPSCSSVEQHRDVVIVGGGLAGLSAAFYLKAVVDPTKHVTILDKEPANASKSASGVASWAAAGMLAPHSERLPPGPLLNLCLESRDMYRDFVQLVERYAANSGPEGQAYLPKDDFDDDGDDNGSGNDARRTKLRLKPWQVGYTAAGGFLAPAFAGDSVATWAPPELDDGRVAATWLDAAQVRELEPHLHPQVIGGWWFPEDASVDARRLTASLQAACIAAGVQILHDCPVTSLDLQNGKCRGVWCRDSMYIHCHHSVLIANGAWMRQLLPVPMEPHKGQSLALRQSLLQPILRRVLFAQDSYIVPKPDGRIVVGATVEAGTFDTSNTPAGLLHILQHATQLVPALAKLPIEDMWCGLRPTTPDKLPILGKTWLWNNLYVAGGYWRNGVLLAPKTGLLMARLLASDQQQQQQETTSLLNEQDQAYLEAFAWNRFTTQDTRVKKRAAANARFAASMHPIQTRTTGVGVAASVGTELGSYSSARDAKEERTRDRQALLGGRNGRGDGNGMSGGNDDSLLEQAAALGRQDAEAYIGWWNNESPQDEQQEINAENSSPSVETSSLESSALPSVSSSSSSRQETSSLEEAYRSIQANKKGSSASRLLADSSEEEKKDRPDPGFRIYHVGSETGQEREVPPYTTPAEFLSSIRHQRESHSMTATVKESTNTAVAVSNKVKDESPTEDDDAAKNDLSHVYAFIRANKQKGSGRTTWAQLLEETGRGDEENSNDDDERPDPGFRIYHVDAETGEERIVPPYTTPADFLASLHAQKQQQQQLQPQPPPATTRNKGSPHHHQKQQQHASLGMAPPANEITTSSTQADSSSSATTEYNEQTFDGYTVIQQAYSGTSRKDELLAMRKARQQNRLETTDTSQIGVHDWNSF